MNPEEFYTFTAETLVQRISALMPTYPEIMDLDSPWDLFKVDPHIVDGLDVTMFQADWALRTAQQKAKSGM